MVQYVQFLVAGGGGASWVPGPLGDRFFLRTGAQCTDISGGQKVKRSLYINNVPTGHIPGISTALSENFSMLEGILPGTIFALGNLNPLAIFQAFMSGVDPSCQAITLPTRDVNNVLGAQTEFMTDPDIATISPCLFQGTRNPISGKTMGGCDGQPSIGFLGGTVNDGNGGGSGTPPSPDVPSPVQIPAIFAASQLLDGTVSSIKV